MLLRAARDSAVTQIYLNSEVWKCSFTLVISFNKHCIVPSLYILYCSICCYGQWCQVSVRFFWETRQNSGFSFLLLCLCSWPLQCSPLPSSKTSSQTGKHCPLQSLHLYTQQQSLLGLNHCSREAMDGFPL